MKVIQASQRDQLPETRNSGLRMRIVRILRITRKCLSALAFALRTPMRGHAHRANPAAQNTNPFNR